MKFRCALLALTSLVLSGMHPTYAQSGKPVTLQLHLAKGSSYSLATDMTQKIVGSSDGVDVNINQRMVYGLTMKVTEVTSDGNQRFRTTYDRLAINQNIDAGGQHMEMVVDTKDSTRNKGESAPDIATKLGKLMGVSYASEYDKLGALISTNLDSVISLYQANDFAGSSENNQYSVSFPDHSVTVGDSWHSKSLKNEGGQDIATDITYTLKSVGATSAEIGFVTHMSGNMPDGTLDGTINGTYTVELATGWTTSATMKLSMDMKVKQGDVVAPMKIVSDITMTSGKLR